MKKRILRILSIALIGSLLLCCIPAQAANDNDGWLSITIGDDKSPFDRKGIEVAVYMIATGDYGNWTMVKDFADITVFTRDDGSTHIDKSLAQIRKRIQDQGIKPEQKKHSDANGKAEFKNMKRGIYFVWMTHGVEGLTIQPMLLSAPNKEGSVQIRAIAKYEYVEETPTPSPTPTQKPTPTPFETPEVSPTPTPTPPPGRQVTPTPPSDTDTPTTGIVTPTAPPHTAPPSPTPYPTEFDGPTPYITPPPTQTPEPSETPIIIDDNETALGLGNIQMHVGVCFE